METTDRYGNKLVDGEFIPLPVKDKEDKPVSVPSPEVDKSYKLTKSVDGVELSMTLDYLYIQRGRDEKTSKKGWKYPGKRINKDNLTSVIEFWGDETVAAFLDTALNTRFQMFAEQAIKDKWTEDELVKTYATLTVREGDSKAALTKEMQETAAKIKTLTPTDAEYMPTMLKLAELAQKFAAK